MFQHVALPGEKNEKISHRPKKNGLGRLSNSQFRIKSAVSDLPIPLPSGPENFGGFSNHRAQGAWEKSEKVRSQGEAAEVAVAEWGDLQGYSIVIVFKKSLLDFS